MTYRPDIDGLRAIAVLSVVIFHLGVTGFDGGFVGVDVFFVISGYLITSILLRELDAGGLSLRTFYFRRIRRLLPAVIATVVLTTAASAWLMSPYDFQRYSRSAVAALFSLSNVVFFIEAGYWDTASELKPLLHTWSLGVEEQFYLFWPALVALLFAVRQRLPITLACMAISLGGFLLCVWYTAVDQAAAFYLLPFRVFQFATGALLIPLAAQMSQVNAVAGRVVREAAFWTGLGLIAYSVHFLGGGVAFPGWQVSLPTLGAMLVLLAGAGDAGHPRSVSLLLSNSLSVWVGKVSYAMYLVHWPVIALYRYQFGTELHAGDQALLAAATVALAVGMHYGVERRFYRRSTMTERGGGVHTGGRFALGTLVIALLVAAFPASAWLGDGWSWRSPNLQLSPERIESGKQRRFDYIRHSCPVQVSATHPACRRDAELQIMVFGDSHEPDGYNFLKGVFGDAQDVNLVTFGSLNRCPDFSATAEGFSSSDEFCQARLDGLFDPQFLAGVDLLVYAANRPFMPWKQEMIDVVLALKARRPEMRLAVIGGYINTRRDCSWHINRSGVTETCALPANVDYFGDAPEQQALYPLLQPVVDLYVDRVELLCKNRVLETCLTRTPEGIPAWYDQHHLSLEFAVLAGELYERRFPGRLRALANGG